jgi:pimeloyl-ACP methyl ester carboxylesterase
MAAYLLIHGAWHGAWCWDTLAASLRGAGHQVRAIDLPGMGEDHTPLKQVTMQAWTDRVVKELAGFATPAVLVGHSMGGMVITAAADAAPECVSRLVYVCAFLPQDGESLVSLATRPEGASALLQQIPSADGLSVSVTPQNARLTFYGECSAADAARAAARLTPQPLQPALAPLKLRNAQAARLPRVYIECTQDRAIPIELQRFMAKRAAGARLESLPADHSPFLSMPERLLPLLQKDGEV